MKRISDDRPMREHLQNELKRRQRANQAYSLRAFARDLNLNPGFLSTILVGKRGMSLERWTETFGRMGLNADETVGVSGLLAAKSKPTQKMAMTENELSLDAFQLVSDWYHFALGELTLTEGFSEDPAQLSERLGISEAEATQALLRLLNLGILARDANGKLVKTTQMVSAVGRVPSQAVRSYHAQMLEKAKHSLQTQGISERDITGLSIAIHPSKIEEFREEIKKFRLKLARMAGSSEDLPPTEVYQIEMALFRLSNRATPPGEVS